MSKTDCKCKKEMYSYPKNQPKNQSELVIKPNFLISEPYKEKYDKNSEYSYAMYKPERHSSHPSLKFEKTFPGVL